MNQIKKHIVVISETSSGGTRKHIIDLLKGIDKSRFKLSFIYSPKRADDTFLNELDNLKKLNIDLFEVGMIRAVNPLVDLISFIKVFVLLKKLKPDIVHLHASKAGVLGRGACKLLRIKNVIFNPHGGSFHRFNGRLGWFYFFIEKLLAFKNIHYIGVSKYACSLFQKHFDIQQDKNHLIYNGIEIKELKEYSAAENNKLNVLWPAFFFSEKGHVEFIQTAAKVVKLNSNIIIRLAGIGILMEEVKGLIEKNNLGSSFEFLGFRKDVSRLIEDSDVVILPSKFEFFPYAILESFERGRAVLATKAGAIPEVIDCGINGELFDFSKTDELIRRLNYFSENKHQLIPYGIEARKKVESCYPVELMIKKTEELYLHILEQTDSIKHVF